MRCDGELLSRFVDGELGEVQLEELTSHLARCASCRAEVGEMRRINQVLSAWGSVLRPVPSSTERRVRTSVERRRRLAPLLRLSKLSPPAVGSSIAALLLLLVVNTGPLYQAAAPASQSSPRVAPVIKRQSAPLQLARGRAAVVATNPGALQRLMVHHHFEALVN